MEASGTVTVLGVRGSFPVTGKDYLEYSGNTSCFLADLGGFNGELALVIGNAAAQSAITIQNCAVPG